jgi:uncharacterized protein with FMN-binding domain
MKRAPWLVAAGALAGFLGVLGLHKTAAPGALASGGIQPASQSSRSTQASQPGQPRHAGQPAHASRRGPTPAGGTRATPTAGATAAGATVTSVGTLERYGYGELAARVSISGGRITAITVPVLHTAEQYSQQLAAQVLPTLRSEVLAAQSARISAVSGATYTSQAYALSVQAALDKAHFR